MAGFKDVPADQNKKTDLLSQSDLKLLFEEFAQIELAFMTGEYAPLVKKLNTEITKLRAAGADVSLKAMSLHEKTRLKIDKKYWEMLQLTLKVHDREYVLFPIDQNQFYMHKRIINKVPDHKYEYSPDPEHADEGTVFSFDDTDSINTFLTSLAVTAGKCAGKEGFLAENGLSGLSKPVARSGQDKRAVSSPPTPGK